MEAADGGCSSRGCWEPQAFLWSAIFLSLCLCLAHKIWHGCFGETRTSPSRPCRAGAQLLEDLGSPTQWVHQESTRKRAAGEDTGGSPDLAVAPSRDGIAQRPGQSSIRHLLCDNMKCALCAQVAEEASQMGRPPDLGLQFSPSPKPLALPAVCDVEPSSCLGLSLPTGQDTFPQSISEPAPIRGHSFPPLRAASTGDPAGSRPKKQQPCFPPSCSAHWARSTVTLSSSFSSISDFSISSCTKGSSSSIQSRGLFHAVLLQEEICEYCSQIKSEVSSGSRGQKGRKRHFHSTPQEAAPHRHQEQRGQEEEPTFLGPRESQRAGFRAADTPFTAEAMRASLEWHLLAKRVQHKMGLPLLLLKSLRAFTPPAPESASGQGVRNFAAMPRPQALRFLSEDSKRELEQHLQKMVQLKRWGLPQRVREALGHMKPGSRSPGGRASPEEQRMEKASQTVPLCADMTFQPAPIFQPKLPAPQKMAGVEESNWPVPAPVPLGHSDLQPSSRLTLQRKADNVALSPKHQPFQAVPPTQVTPTSPLRMHPAPTEGQTELMAPADVERLEGHILRKRLQHHWGLPRLLRQSLHLFCATAPPPPPPRFVPSLPFRLEVKVFLPASQFHFIPEEAQRWLDDHVRTLVAERRWGLPKRAKRALHTFMPVSPPRTKVPKEREKGRVSPKVQRSLSADTPRPSKRRTGLSEGEAPLSRWQRKYQAVQRHLVKKALEIQMGLFCPVVQRSRETVSQGRKRALPQIALPGPRVVQPRCQEIPFIEQVSLDRIKLNITHKKLTYQWGLPTLYRKSLARLFLGTAPPTLRPLSPTPPAGVDSTAVETPFIGKQSREELEWHVKRKQLQHLWGLPGLVQRSLRHLLPATPLLPGPKIGPEKALVSLQQLSFLSKETAQKLDLHVRKRVILQRWGLPRVVLRSLRGLSPEKAFPPRGRRASKPHLPCSPRVRTFPGASTDNGQARRRGVPAPHQAPVCPVVGPKDPATMAHHVARKSVEVRLGILPAVARQSWRLALLSTRQRLPRPIRHGQGALRPRRRFLPFARMEDVDRIEVAVSRNHLSSLWGLGLRYVEALAAMVPKPPSAWLVPRRPGMAFQEMPTPFFPRQDRMDLELSIRKKRLQHEWSLPLLIQKSLKALMEGLPTLPARPQAGVRVSVLPQELSFLPQSILRHLEFHVQKMKLHHQWGLPRRVLQSVRVVRPQVAESHGKGWQGTQSPLAPEHCRHATSSAPSALVTQHSTQRAERTVAAATPGHSPQPFRLAPRNLEKLRLHVAKKCVEVRLGAFPALARLSWRRVPLKLRLPRLLLPSHNLLQPRSHFLPFVQREDWDRIELAVRHHHLRSLWGLGTLYVEAIAGMAPKPFPRSLVPSTAPLAISEAKTPFLPERDREAIELLVRRKRLQHMWGLPALIRRALTAFVPTAPSAPACPKPQIQVQIHGTELSFLSPDVCRTLELHIQKMKIQRRWGRPHRVLKSLKMFLLSHCLGKTGSESGRQRSPPAPDRELPPTERSLSPRSRPLKEEAPLSHVAPTRSPVPHPAFQAQLVTKGTKTPPVGRKQVPSGDGLLGAAQWQGEGRAGRAAHPLPFLLREGGRPSSPKKSVNKKLSLIGSILEKKLHLEHGLHTWLRDQERQRDRWRERDRKGGLRGADRTDLQGGQGEGQVASSALRASEKAQGLSPTHTLKSQPLQAGRIVPPVRLEGGSVELASGKPSRVSPRGKSRSLALERISRERGRGRGLTPMARGRKQASANRERREQRPSSKEWKSSGKEWRSGIKEWQLSSKDWKLGSKEQSKEQALSSKEQRPGSKEQRPGSKEGRPGSKERRLGSKERRRLDSKERMPSSKEGRPSSKEGSLSSMEQRPSDKEQRPGSKEQRPGSKERRPGSKERRPSSKERSLSSKEQRPGSKERSLSSKEQRPSSKERKPSSKEQRLSSTEQRPGSNERRPGSKERRPGSQERRPSSKKWKPSSKEQRLSSMEQRPGSNERRPGSKERRPDSQEGRLSSKKQKPSSKEQRLSSKERRLGSNERRLGNKERRPGSQEGRLSSKERKPSSKEQRLSSKERRPDSKEGRPSSKEGRLSSREQRPGGKEQRSSSKERRPRSKEGRPGSIEQRLGSKEVRASSKEGRTGSLERRLGSEDQRPGSEERRSRSKERRSRSKEQRLSSKKSNSEEERPSSTKRR